MKTLKPFELRYNKKSGIDIIDIVYAQILGRASRYERSVNIDTIDLAYNWLEQNGYITREDERIKK